MSREIAFNVFKFTELSEEAKEKAINVIREKGWHEDFLTDDLKDCFREKVLEFGFNDDVKIEFSLSYSQGDGVAFYGEIDFDKWIVSNEDKFLRKELKRLKWLSSEEAFTIDVSRNSFGFHYSHFNTMIVSVEFYNNASYRGEEVLNSTLDILQGILKAQVKDLSKELEKIGYDDIEFHNTDDYIRDMIIANEYEFLEDGSFY